MSHILFISPYYPPEKAAAAVCVSENATRLAQRGHRVTVLTTFPNYPTGVIWLAYRGHIIQQETLEGVHVVRIWQYTSPNKGFLRRILAQLSFGCLTPLLGWKQVGRPDIIIVQSPPLFDAIAARVLARLKGCPFIFMVSDLWPESAVQLGVLQNRLLIKLAEWLEWSTYQRASRVWVVTEGIRQRLLERGLAPERIVLLTNGVNTATFHPIPQAHARAELGWDERFTLLYAGNHGLVYSMKTLLDVAAFLQEYPDIHMILVGDGVRKAELVAEARKRRLKNVTFLDPVAHERLPLLWAAADVCLIPFRKLPLLKGSLPVKMFEIMACARPFVLAAEGIARDLAGEQARAGIVVEPENAEAMVSAILYLRAHPEETEALGMRGRAYVQSHFDYDQLVTLLDEHIAMLLHTPAPVLNSRVSTPVGALSREG